MLLKFASLKKSRTFAVYLITQVHLFFEILVQQKRKFKNVLFRFWFFQDVIISNFFDMKELSITTENFSVIRETLKGGESCRVNNIVTLTGFEANTQKVGASGKITRTPFKYVSESGTRYTSTTLKELLGIEAETKGVRKETTFASLWEQASKLAENAELSELENAAETLGSIIEAKKKAAEKAAENRKAALIAELAAMGVKVEAPKKSSRKSK